MATGDGNRARDAALRARAAAVIPGGMYGHQSTRMLPDDYPQFFDRGEGAYLWDADGNRYLDLMCAYGPNLFGYGDAEIDAAYAGALADGDCLTGPSALMVELAETFVGMIDHADWAMFCKNGTDATTMALTTARACTGRKTVILARGSYHGAAPWCTPQRAGITEADRANQIHCVYNDVASLEAAVAEAGDDLAAIFATPFKHDAFVDQQAPDPGYAERARALCDKHGALLVVDDVRGGFRIARDCSWSLLGIKPDLSTWGKCIANGHPISALLGSDVARDAAASIYATGSFWLSSAAMAAALVTLRRIRTTDYLEHLQAIGERLRTGLDRRARDAGIGLRQSGPVQMPLFLFEGDRDLRQGFFWCSAMLERGIYTHPWHNMFLCAAMTEADIDAALDAAAESFAALKAAKPTLQPVPKLAAIFG